ncbi:DNA cytosine methyltransferase [Yinghuangia seranimata]|uniref:DNA cytosine methyltransferase n=1 Tax=Yinghuangia seranimata TaxID=408067 RepID=UPI00248BEFDF|nr:DNA cytosine methyltransferase [Yinghuangia seranimata]MDI2130876.1 DNA cytosine methyltransferase [Yinghuangia seranimata]
MFTSVEMCSGAGGMALGFAEAGFAPRLLFDRDPQACETVRSNRPDWDVRELDLLGFEPTPESGLFDVDLLAGGLPRVRSSATRARAESEVEMRLLREAVSLASLIQPRAVVIENVPDLATSPGYREFRDELGAELSQAGYQCRWGELNALDFLVPQKRQHGFVVALRPADFLHFHWPAQLPGRPATVGETLGDSMGSRGWTGATEWAVNAADHAPAIVGGSSGRGGADLGPSGSKAAWRKLGVEGKSIADEVPGPEGPRDHGGRSLDHPMLTVRQVMALQGFPDSWRVGGAKTAAYRQVGHACPPPVARAIGQALVEAFGG